MYAKARPVIKYHSSYTHLSACPAACYRTCALNYTVPVEIFKYNIFNENFVEIHGNRFYGDVLNPI